MTNFYFHERGPLSGKAEGYRLERVGGRVCAGVALGERGAGETIHAAAIHAMTHGTAMTYLAWNCQMNSVADKELGYVSSSWPAVRGRGGPVCCSLQK